MSSMTYLELCQRTASECGMAGTVPTAVAGQTGDLRRIVNWVAAAWNEIQRRHANWQWMRSRFTVNTVADDDSYAYGDCTDVLSAAAIDRFSKWWLLDDEGRCNAFIYLASAGVGTQTRLTALPWPSFRQIYKFGSQTSSYPSFVTTDPQQNLVLGPAPNGIYTVTGEFQRGALDLTVDGDTPDMPADFHELIVYRAMEKYGAFKAATEVFNRGVGEGRRLMRQLELEQLPAMPLAGPLA